MLGKGESLAPRLENTTKPFWTLKINAHEVEARYCIDEELKVVLKFLVSIVYPEKPNRVTMLVGSIVIATYKGNFQIYWAEIICKAMEKMTLSPPTKTSPCCLPPILYTSTAT